MPFTTVCPNCDARLTAPDTIRGKKVRCKKCDEPFVARPAAGDDEEDDRPARPEKAAAAKARPRPARDEDDDEDDAPPRKSARSRRPADDDEDDEPRARTKKKGKKKAQSSPLLLIVMIGVVIVALAGAGVGVYFAFINSEDVPETPVGQGKGPPPPPPGPGGPPGGPGAAGAWVEHADAEGKFRISFPGPPTTQNQTINVDGVQQTLKVTQYQLRAGIEVFVANAVVIPPDRDADPEALLDIAEAEAGNRMQNTTVISKQPVTHAGVKGRELVLSIQSPGGQLTGVVRLFVNNGRIYTLGVVGPAVQTTSPNVVKYFESMKFE